VQGGIDGAAHGFYIGSAFAPVGIVYCREGEAQVVHGLVKRSFKLLMLFAHAPRHLARDGFVFDKERLRIENIGLIGAALVTKLLLKLLQLGGSALLGLPKPLQGSIGIFWFGMPEGWGSRHIAECVPDADAGRTTDPLIML
jgi:hypothetical protein